MGVCVGCGLGSSVSKWLGNSTFTLTLNTYGDWIPDDAGGSTNYLPQLQGAPIPTMRSAIACIYG